MSESGGDASESAELAELRAAFERGDYQATRAGARRLAERAVDETVRAEASALAKRTEASRGMIAAYLAGAAVVAAVCGYWVVWGR